MRSIVLASVLAFAATSVDAAIVGGTVTATCTGSQAGPNPSAFVSRGAGAFSIAFQFDDATMVDTGAGYRYNITAASITMPDGGSVALTSMVHVVMNRGDASTSSLQLQRADGDALFFMSWDNGNPWTIGQAFSVAPTFQSWTPFFVYTLSDPLFLKLQGVTLTDFTAIPAPGAIALLGVAGLARGRRRRG